MWVRSRSLTVLDLNRWIAFDKDRSAPTFFSRPGWAMALAHCYPNMRPAPLVMTVDGQELLIPMVRIEGKGLKWKTYCGMPLGGYATILTADGAVPDKTLIEGCLERLARANIDYVELNSWPFAPVLDPNDQRYTAHETSVIDLRRGPDEALSRMSGNSRRMAGQAARRGVTCARETGDKVAKTYFDLLLSSATRWGLTAPKIPKTFIEALIRFGGDDAEVWIARYEGEAIAGMLALYGKHEVSVWSAAMRGNMAVLRPHNLLNVMLIRAAAERGMRWYNLGSSEGLPGVKKFKEGLGAVNYHYRTYVHMSPMYRLYSMMRSLTRKRQRTSGADAGEIVAPDAHAEQ